MMVTLGGHFVLLLPCVSVPISIKWWKACSVSEEVYVNKMKWWMCMHFDKCHMIYKYPLIIIIIKMNDGFTQFSPPFVPCRRPASSREAGTFQGARREAGRSWIMVRGLMTHSGTVSRRAVKVKKGNHVSKWQVTGWSWGRQARSRQSQGSLLGELVKREEWGDFLLCGFSSEQKEGLKFFQRLLFMSLQGFLVCGFLDLS